MNQSGQSEWRKIGTVLGSAGATEFTFILKPSKARIGDIIALETDVGDSTNGKQNPIYVWARITEIRRVNPFFPYEAAQEIAKENISLEDTILSDAHDQLEASALILGSAPKDKPSHLELLTYPVKPASSVLYPPAEEVQQLLIGGKEGEKKERKIQIGALTARSDVKVELSASSLVARHLAILAMTGGGKTVAAWQIIRELMKHDYPILILDPHGDYLGLQKEAKKASDTNQKKAPEIKLFYPELQMQKGGEFLIEQITDQMTDNGLTETQSDILNIAFKEWPAKDKEATIKYIKRIIGKMRPDSVIEDDKTFGEVVQRKYNRNSNSSINAVRRSLSIVQKRLEGMQKTSEKIRENPRLRLELEFDKLPDPFSKPSEIIRPGQVSILYLGGYDHITQCSITAITLEALFNLRAGLGEEIAPFLTVIEEAHTFIPSAREGKKDAVSLPVIQRVITEGRKFGTGLILISQRPSRLDETVISQCNSFLILRLVNPRDQNFVRSVMENLTESDIQMIPAFGPGQGIVSGQAVRFPLHVKIKEDADLQASEIGDEDFLEQAIKWEKTQPAKEQEKANGKPAPKGSSNRPKASPRSQPKGASRGRRTPKKS